MRRSLIAGIAACAAAGAPLAAQAQYAQQPYYGAQAGAQAGVQSSPLNSIFSCAAAGNKQAGGAAVGGVLGGLLGNQVARGERTLGTVIGAAAGAALGSYIGCRMQTSDQQRAYAAAQTALQTGRNETWTNPQTGAYGSTRVLSSEGYGQTGYGQPGAQTTTYGSAQAGQTVSLAGLRVASNVQLQTQLETPPSPVYVAPSQANLRAGPSTRTAIVGRLKAGDQVDGLARVRGQSWLLVGRNGTGIGYVSESVVRAAAPQATTYASSGGYTQTAASSQPCRLIEQTVNTPGAQPVVERYRACQGSDGQWNVSRA